MAYRVMRSWFFTVHRLLPLLVFVSLHFRYILACRIAEELADLARKHNLLDDPELVGALQVMVGEEMFLLLHLTMFMCTLEAMCNEEQVFNKCKHIQILTYLSVYRNTSHMSK